MNAGNDPVSPPAYRIDGRLADHEAFYRVACDPARSAAVEACAGAGKTWMLVSRMLRALLAGAKPQEIVAITFTRKAAGEMRERLDQWLREFAAADPALRIAELKLRGMSEFEAVEAEPRLAGLFEATLAADRPVEISTFHRWFWRLLRAAPIEALEPLGLHAGMTLIEDEAELKPDLMRRFHSRVDADPEALAAYRDLCLRHGRFRLGQWLDAVLAGRIEIERCAQIAESLADPAEVWPDAPRGSDPAVLLASDGGLRRDLETLARTMGRGRTKAVSGAGAKLRAALDEAGPEAAFAIAWDALFTQKDEPRKLGEIDGLETARVGLERLKAMREQFIARADHLRMLSLARLLLDCWRDCKREHQVADMQDLESCAFALLSDPAVGGWIQQRLDARVRHLLIDEFQDTSPLQWQALQTWLSAYAGAGGGAEAPVIFVVGDPKQSIYRFRRAEPRVFGAACAFVRDTFGGALLGCDHTRRNAQSLVQGFNTVFAAAASGREFDGFRPHTTAVGGAGDGVMVLSDADDEADPAPAAVGHSTATASVEPATHPSSAAPASASAPDARGWRDSLTTPRIEAEEERRMHESRRVATAIDGLLARGLVRPEQILVLARRRVALAAVDAALRERGIPCVAAEDLKLIDIPEVADLIAVLDLLVSPAHDASLARALKSPLFAADDAELLALSRRAKLQRSSWSAALADWSDRSDRSAWNDRDDRDDRSKRPDPGDPPPALARARDAIAAWSAASSILPPHDLLDRIVADSDAIARFAAAAPPHQRQIAVQAVEALLWRALDLGEGRHATPYAFVRALRRGLQTAAAPIRPDAVRLMTVHGAKGLEAEHVFVVDADAIPNTRSDPGLMVDWPLDADRPARVALVSNRESPPASLWSLHAVESRLDARENLNLLYVAMTRARRSLVFSRTEPSRNRSGISWWGRIQGIAKPWSANEESGAAESTRATVGEEPVRIADLPPLDRIGAKPGPGPRRPQDPAAVRVGIALHRALEWASSPLTRSSGRTTTRAEWVEAAARRDRLSDDERLSLASRLDAILDAAELARFFDASLIAWAANEWTLIDDGETLRLDRIVQFAPQAGGECWVLDYKSGSLQAEHRQQIGRYRRAVQKLMPDATVRAILIAGDAGWSEVGAGE